MYESTTSVRALGSARRKAAQTAFAAETWPTPTLADKNRTRIGVLLLRRSIVRRFFREDEEFIENFLRQGSVFEQLPVHVGDDELIKKVQGGWTDFDVALATQDMMGQVSRLGKILGPRGLMPTPKAGTVITGDVANAVREFKAGKVEYRTDKGGNVHAGVGKMSFDDDRLAANITTFVDQIRAVKPAGVKGNYVKSITVKGTMTPGIAVTM